MKSIPSVHSSPFALSPLEFLGQRHRRSASWAVKGLARTRASIAGRPHERSRTKRITGRKRVEVRLVQAAFGTRALHWPVAVVALNRSRKDCVHGGPFVGHPDRMRPQASSADGTDRPISVGATTRTRSATTAESG